MDYKSLFFKIFQLPLLAQCNRAACAYTKFCLFRFISEKAGCKCRKIIGSKLIETVAVIEN